MRRVVAEQIEALSELNAIVRAAAGTRTTSATAAPPPPPPSRVRSRVRHDPARCRVAETPRPCARPRLPSSPAPRTVTVAEAPACAAPRARPPAHRALPRARSPPSPRKTVVAGCATCCAMPTRAGAPGTGCRAAAAEPHRAHRRDRRARWTRRRWPKPGSGTRWASRTCSRAASTR